MGIEKRRHVVLHPPFIDVLNILDFFPSNTFCENQQYGKENSPYAGVT